jgi:hypothetical protein
MLGAVLVYALVTWAFSARRWFRIHPSIQATAAASVEAGAVAAAVEEDAPSCMEEDGAPSCCVEDASSSVEDASSSTEDAPSTLELERIAITEENESTSAV